MDDIQFDSNDLIRQFDTVSRSQRALVAECERQQSRLIHLLRWYDQQKIARNLELCRQSELLDKETRQQINAQSKKVVQERARLKHLLDDDRTYVKPAPKSLLRVQDPTADRKRKVYGCLLPKFKAPLSKSLENWSHIKSNSVIIQSIDKKQRWSTNKSAESFFEQRNRMNKFIDKCLYQFGECEGNGYGYDHFLRTSQPNRNAQILTQQIINDQNPNKCR